MIVGEVGGGGRDEPDPLPGVQMTLREVPGAFPDAIGHCLVVDFLAQRHDLGDGVPRYERERRLTRGVM